MQLSIVLPLNNRLRETQGAPRLAKAISNVAFLTAATVLTFFCGAAWGQQSNARVETEDGRTRPSARSLLDSTQPNGRIGGFRYRGALKATPGDDSRFGNGAIYGSAGNIVGVDNNSANSAFQSSSRRFQTKKNFDLIAFRNELNRARAAQATSNGAPAADPNAPRVVAANAPKAFSKTTDRRVRYGDSPEEIAAQALAQNARNAANFESRPNVDDVAPDGRAPRQIWMRGPAPNGISASTGDGRVDRNGFDVWGSGANGANFNGDADPFEARWVELDPNVRSEFGGAPAATLAPSATALPALAPTPEQTQAAFQEYLEAQLLRSPDVNALSPVRVDFRNGIATIQGIVPTPKAREIAGQILLADPRVERVDNRLSFVRGDVDSVPTPTPAANNVDVPRPTTLPDLAPLR